MPNLDQACSAILTHTLAPSVNFINVFKYKFFVRSSFRQLFLEQIPKAQKDIDDLTVFIRFCDPRM